MHFMVAFNESLMNFPSRGMKLIPWVINFGLVFAIEKGV
jgi:hypothetical protein